MTPIPALDSLDAPKYWLYEQGGELVPAVNRYLSDQGKVTARDIVLLRAYTMQWVDSPVWDQNPAHTADSLLELDALRRQARRIATVEDLTRWLAVALDAGIDPL